MAKCITTHHSRMFSELPPTLVQDDLGSTPIEPIWPSIVGPRLSHLRLVLPALGLLLSSWPDRFRPRRPPVRIGISCEQPAEAPCRKRPIFFLARWRNFILWAIFHWRDHRLCFGLAHLLLKIVGPQTRNRCLQPGHPCRRCCADLLVEPHSDVAPSLRRWRLANGALLELCWRVANAPQVVLTHGSPATTRSALRRCIIPCEPWKWDVLKKRKRNTLP